MKTITLDDEAYTLLKGLKLSPGDSFSDVVKRQLGSRGNIDDSAGGWADVSEKRLKALRRDAVDTFGTTTG